MMLQQGDPAPLKNQAEKDLIGSVQRALCILELLAHQPTGLNAKRIGQQPKLNLSTYYHLLNTLNTSGYAVRGPNTLLFCLSDKAGYTSLNHASLAELGA